MTSGSVSLVLLPQLTVLSSAVISPCDEPLKSTVKEREKYVNFKGNVTEIIGKQGRFCKK